MSVAPPSCLRLSCLNWQCFFLSKFKNIFVKIHVLDHRVAPPSCSRFSFTISVTAAFSVLGRGIAGKMLGCGWWANLHIRWCQIISCKHSCSCYPAELQLATYEGCSHECSEGFFHKPLNLSVAVSCEKLANRCRHRNLLTWQKCRMSHFNNSPCANTHPASDVWHLWQVALM